MQGKRNYKDSLFRNIFKDKKRLCSLYNALSGENISPRDITCLLYTSPSPRDRQKSRMPSSA